MKIENSIVRIVDNDISQSFDSIDKLTLINNYYISDNSCKYINVIEIRVELINELTIFNIPKYITNEYYKLFDKVQNNGKITLNNINLINLNCRRFESVTLIDCNVYNIINDNCNIICNSSLPPNIKYINRIKIKENINNVDTHLYTGIGYYDNNNNLIPHCFGESYFTPLSNHKFIQLKIESYEGGYNCGKRDGFGTLYTVYNDKYKGEWKDDKCNGLFVIKYNDGKVYRGMMKDNNKNGIGTLTDNEGKKCQGRWWNDKMILVTNISKKWI